MIARASILIVDDDESLARALVRVLTSAGHQVTVAYDGAQARRKMRELFPDIALLDLRLPDIDGTELMVELKEEYPDTRFIILTGHGTIDMAVEATRKGAANFLTKPCENEKLILAVDALMREATLNAELRLRRSQAVGDGPGFAEDLTCDSPAMRQVRSLARKVAGESSVILLLGESGTGKNHLANWIHRESNRAAGPYFTINCAALPRDLAEAELFGYEPGAFTGAVGRKRGLLQLADGGTIVLDEIGELDAVIQSKLLGFLDSRTFVRVGGENVVRVDARIIVATNRSLIDAVEAGRFREDLYHRLNVFSIELPPLRDRPEDIPPLARVIIDRLAVQAAKASSPTIDPPAMRALRSYSWPGNVRELRNVLERSLILSSHGTIRRSHLTLSHRGGQWQHVVRFPTHKSLHDVTAEVARQLVTEALRRGQSKRKAAELLGISRHALAYQIQTLGLDE